MAYWDFLFTEAGFLIVLNTVGFVTALLAAILWYRSAKAEVPFNDMATDDFGMRPAAIIVEHADGRRIDPFETAALANKYSAKAAFFAAAAAFCQAGVYFLPLREKIITAASEISLGLVAIF